MEHIRNAVLRSALRVESPGVIVAMAPVAGWRREPESNRHRRICNPQHDHSAIAPANAAYRSCKTVRNRAFELKAEHFDAAIVTFGHKA